MRVGVRSPVAGWTIVLLSVLSLSAGAGDVRLPDAVQHKQSETIRTLLRQKADVNVPQADGATALHWAVRWDDAGTTDLLLRAGAKASVANDYGVTPLALACINRNGAMVTKLLAAGADPNAATTLGETVLMTCARTGSADGVLALLKQGATTINAKETSRNQTALMWAAQGHPEVVRVLVEFGADVGARTSTRRLLVSLGGRGPSGEANMELGGFTPLLFAARHGDADSARILLDGGADVNEATPDGASALVVSSFSGHTKIGALLLERGANPNAAGAGYTALHTAVLRGNLDLVKALLAHKADPNVRLTKGSRSPRSSNWWVIPGSLAGATPFLLAANYAEVEIMRALAANGANPLLTTEDGMTPLMAASGASWPNALNPVDRRGRYVPAEVAEALMTDDQPSYEAAKVAIELGADVNGTNQEGDTALHSAVYKAWPKVIDLLVGHGAKMDIKNKRGKAPMDLACHEGAKLVRCAA